MSLTLYVVFEWQFWYEVKSCRIFKNLWLLTSYKNCESKELASREWVSEIINFNLVDIRFSITFLSSSPSFLCLETIKIYIYFNLINILVKQVVCKCNYAWCFTGYYGQQSTMQCSVGKSLLHILHNTMYMYTWICRRCNSS